MKEEILAKRYGEAFLRFTQNTFGPEKAATELKELEILLRQNPDFYQFLDNLDIEYTQKFQVVDKVLLNLSQETRNFIKFLIEKGRIKIIFEVCAYLRINYTGGGTLDSLLKTSYPLDVELIRRIKETLEAKLKKRINLHIELDPDLIGGVRVLAGNMLFDGSLQKRLDDLRKKLMAIKVS